MDRHMRFWEMLRHRAAMVLVGLAVLAGPAYARPPVWVVKDHDSRIVLFGSIHVLPPMSDGKAPDWLPPSLARDLAAAQDVWFELPIDPNTAAQVSQLALARGLLPKGQTLSSRLSILGRDRLARLAARTGFRADQLERFQPWLAEATISVAVFQHEGASGKEGVEQILSARLGQDVVRNAFETPQAQIGFLASASPSEQLASLEETLRQFDEDPLAYKKLVTAWMVGDLAALDREAIEPTRTLTPGLYQVLIRQRNERWVNRLRQRLFGKGTTVIIVGVGHLIGQDGLPAMLRAQGIEVEGP